MCDPRAGRKIITMQLTPSEVLAIVIANFGTPIMMVNQANIDGHLRATLYPLSAIGDAATRGIVSMDMNACVYIDNVLIGFTHVRWTKEDGYILN